MRSSTADGQITDFLFVCAQLGEGSTNGPECRGEEDYEAVQHAGLVEADIQGVEAAEALEARECGLT